MKMDSLKIKNGKWNNQTFLFQAVSFLADCEFFDDPVLRRTTAAISYILYSKHTIDVRLCNDLCACHK